MSTPYEQAVEAGCGTCRAIARDAEARARRVENALREVRELANARSRPAQDGEPDYWVRATLHAERELWHIASIAADALSDTTGEATNRG